MRNFRKWDVWMAGRVLVKAVYELTDAFPDTEKFGLTSQIRRAAVSIPSNIAEGAGRKTEKDFASYLYNALASSYEVETLLILSNDLNLITHEQLETMLTDLNIIQKQLNTKSQPPIANTKQLLLYG